MDNLVLLCRAHHRLVHEAGYGVQYVEGEGAVFSMPDGKIIPHAPQIRSRGNVISIKSRNLRSDLEITPETSVPLWYGDNMDHEMAVDMLLQCE